jgi:hypothetical protein
MLDTGTILLLATGASALDAYPTLSVNQTTDHTHYIYFGLNLTLV